MKSLKYFALLLVMAVSMSSCIVHQSGWVRGHYNYGPNGGRVWIPGHYQR